MVDKSPKCPNPKKAILCPIGHIGTQRLGQNCALSGTLALNVLTLCMHLGLELLNLTVIPQRLHYAVILLRFNWSGQSPT